MLAISFAGAWPPAGQFENLDRQFQEMYIVQSQICEPEEHDGLPSSADALCPSQASDPSPPCPTVSSTRARKLRKKAQHAKPNSPVLGDPSSKDTLFTSSSCSVPDPCVSRAAVPLDRDPSVSQSDEQPITSLGLPDCVDGK